MIPVSARWCWRSDDELLSKFDVNDVAPEALLFQSGYLTILGEEQAFDGSALYRLGYPNYEVRRSLNRSLLAALTPPECAGRRPDLRLAERLGTNDFAGLEELVRGLFAGIPYEWHTRNEIARYEGYYASVSYAWLAAVGLDIAVEDASSWGRADLAVRFAGAVYLFEFKVVEQAPEGSAMAQLQAKGYADKYRVETEEIYLIGLGVQPRATQPRCVRDGARLNTGRGRPSDPAFAHSGRRVRHPERHHPVPLPLAPGAGDLRNRHRPRLQLRRRRPARRRRPLQVAAHAAV